MTITIFHNPGCGTSRSVLAAIREAGHVPEVVEYLQAGWARPQLERLLAAMGATPRAILRVNGTPAEQMGLTQPGVTDDQLLEAMVAQPILVNRPIVVTPKGTLLARPSEAVRALL